MLDGHVACLIDDIVMLALNQRMLKEWEKCWNNRGVLVLHWRKRRVNSYRMKLNSWVKLMQQMESRLIRKNVELLKDGCSVRCKQSYKIPRNDQPAREIPPQCSVRIWTVPIVAINKISIYLGKTSTRKLSEVNLNKRASRSWRACMWKSHPPTLRCQGFQ